MQKNLNLPFEFDETKQIMFAFGHSEEKPTMNKRFKNNMICTTKYNALTWIPKSLLLQFQRVANIYFLLISILTCLSFSPKNPITMIGTFAFVLVFTMLKEGYEDIKRYKQDKEINTKFQLVLNLENNQFEQKLWQDIRVGDIVKIKKEEPVAADMLLIKSSELNGMCSIDTMQLDGETNLKEKYIPPYFKDVLVKDIVKIQGIIVCDYPSAELEKWDCCVVMDGSENVIAELKNLILKGCILKNTEWILGIVTYTGHDTKIMKNAKPPPVKTSNVMRLMNKLLYSVFVVEILICIFFAVGSKYWLDKYGDEIWYIPIENLKVNFGIRILVFLVSYSHLIPISLYVSLEIVKMVQAKLIYYDVKMEDYYMNNRPAIARTSDLIEELGQVEFIFSDKTGTLTKNEMIFRKCSINNVMYGDTIDPNKGASLYNEKQETTQGNNLNTGSFSISGDTKAANDLLSNSMTFGESSDRNLKRIKLLQKDYIYNFFTICSVCHSAYVNNESYISSSPDEVALLEGAKRMGFVFKAKTTNTIETVDIFGKKKMFNIKLELPFDSTRKRMSIIVENSDEYYLYTKGADNEMLAKVNPKTAKSHIDKVKEHLDIFAKEGLRTLVMAQKSLQKSTVEGYIKKYQELTMYQGKDKGDKMMQFFNEIESDFDYVGSSAIEDKLQDGVSDTIDILMKSGIKIWVLTGDKKETAIEIGKSCKLLQKDMTLIDLTSSASTPISNQQNFKNALDNYIEKYKDINDESLIYKQRIFLIIDGKNLTYVFSDKETSQLFFSFAIKAHSVICCRVSPKYKASVVKLAKDNGKWITLAIGDGANDVPMIMEAHIGIGVCGKEGTQAVRSSDYAIGQFQFLKRLILLHGRWGYIRISIFICYYFYKNIVLVCTEIYFAAYNGFSGQLYFPDLLPTCYNCFWTSWPCVIAYSIEKDVEEEESFKYPILYKAGQKQKYFNLKVFWLWIGYAIIHGVITYFSINFLCYCGVMNEKGVTHDHWMYTTLSFSCIINDVTYKTFIDLSHWNALSIWIGIISLVFYYFCLCLLCTVDISRMFQPELLSKFWVIMLNYKTVATFLFLPFISLLVDVTVKLVQKNFFPTPVDIIQLGLLIKEDKNQSQLKTKLDESGQPSKNIFLIILVLNENTKRSIFLQQQSSKSFEMTRIKERLGDEYSQQINTSNGRESRPPININGINKSSHGDFIVENIIENKNRIITTNMEGTDF